MTLPENTVLELPTQYAERMHAAFINETQLIGRFDNFIRVRLTQPLKLCTGAYIAERDMRELELIKRSPAK